MTHNDDRYGFDVFNLGCIGIDTHGNCIAGENPAKYHGPCNTKTGDCPGVYALPIISHETGNYNTYPRLESLIAEFETSGTTIRSVKKKHQLTQNVLSRILMGW